MNRTRNSVLKFLLASFFFAGFAVSSFAGDGPQNSARITLKQLDQWMLEVTLQADKKLFSNPSEVYQFFEIRSKSQVCKSAPPNMISNSDTISAVAKFQCPESLNFIQINLKSVDTLPAGFSLGVQTPFDHFALSTELLSRKTQLSTFRLFLKEGLTLGFQKNHLIGKPYAFSFGGLGVLSWGVWWLFLLIALFVSSLSDKFKGWTLVAVIPISGTISYTLLATQSSLSWIPAPRLDSVFLLAAFFLAVFGFFSTARWTQLVSLFLAGVLVCASGFDLAITLRWLEGNTAVSLVKSITAFFTGLWITTSLLLGVVFYTQKKVPPKSSILRWARLSLMAVTFYTFLCLNLQLL